MRVRLTPSARVQFLEALAYIRSDSPTAFAGILDRATTSLSRLRDFPESGRIVPEFPDLPYREVLVAPYRIFYRVVDDVVWVVAVWHDRQLPDDPDASARG